MFDCFNLHFGPYTPPPFQFGDIVEDERRGTVEIVGLTDAKIPWPIGRPAERGHRRERAIVLYGGLSNAVFSESSVAICHWWGVTSQTVTKWRQALGVERTTKGTSKLYSAHFNDHVGAVMRQAVLPTLGSPDRRAKISRAKTGKARPDVATRNSQRRGSSHSPETRQKMREAHRRRLSVAHGKYRPWTTEEDNLVLNLSASEVSRRTGRTLLSIYARRHKLRSGGAD